MVRKIVQKVDISKKEFYLRGELIFSHMITVLTQFTKMQNYVKESEVY